MTKLLELFGNFDQFLAREIINEMLFAQACVLVYVFGRHLQYEVRKPGWYHSFGNQAAVALLTFFLGEAVARAWTVLFLVQHRHGVRDIIEHYQVALAGAVIATVGALCCVRIFSPEKWKGRGWVIGLGISLAFTIAVLSY